jgi:hypothetical protein
MHEMRDVLNKKTIILSVILCVLFLSWGSKSNQSYIYLKSNQVSINAAQGSEPTYIECEIFKNQSVAWLNSFIIFNISTDESFTLYYSVYGIGDSALKIIPDTAHAVELESGSNMVQIPIKLSFDALPGKYQYDILLTYFNSSSGNPVEQLIYHISEGELQVMMGLPMLLILVGVLFTGLFISIIRQVNVKKENTSTSTINSSITTSTASIVSVEVNEVKTPPASSKPGYFKCPECKKDIKNGSSFCPECGYHIPKFLRNA